MSETLQARPRPLSSLEFSDVQVSTIVEMNRWQAPNVARGGVMAIPRCVSSTTKTNSDSAISITLLADLANVDAHRMADRAGLD